MNEQFYVIVHSTAVNQFPDTVKIIEEYRDKTLVSVTEDSLDELRERGFRTVDLRKKSKLSIGEWEVDPADPEDRARVANDRKRSFSGQASEQDEDRHIVQFIGPVKREWLQALSKLGVQFLRYYPDYAYLVRASASVLEQVNGNLVVRGVIPYTPGFKKSPEVRMLMEDEDSSGEDIKIEIVVTLDAADDASISAFQKRAEALGASIQHEDRQTGGFPLFLVQASIAIIDDIASIPSVYAIDRLCRLKDEDELACQVVAGNVVGGEHPSPGYLKWLEARKVDGSGVIIGLAEHGVDCKHPAFSERIKGLADIGTGSHGTMVASMAAGRLVEALPPDTTIRDEAGFLYAIGVAPGASLVAIPRREFPYKWVATECVGSGGAILNLSAGDYAGTSLAYYGACEAEWDRVVRSADPHANLPTPLICCFSAGNEGENGLTRPKAAKNPIVVGDAVNRSLESASVELNAVSRTSSIGNCADGRVRPDLVAPGTYSSGASFPQPPISLKINHWLSYGSGTSAASPKVAGACALLMQWFKAHKATTPSPALVKAILINAAKDLGAGGAIPNMVQGWGRINLREIFANEQSVLFLDQTVLLQPDAEPFKVEVCPDDPHAPFKVTLVWTDLPGPETGSQRSLVNSLALTVSEESGPTWFGNNFEEGWSVPGGCQDAIQDRFSGEIVNNVQNVFLPDAKLSRYVVRVGPVDIVGDCLAPRDPYSNPGEFRQDFAIVMRNAKCVGDLGLVRQL